MNYYVELREGRGIKTLGKYKYWSVIRSVNNGQVIYRSEMYTSKVARDDSAFAVAGGTGWEIRDEPERTRK